MLTVEDGICRVEHVLTEGSLAIKQLIEGPSQRIADDFRSITTELSRAACHADFAIHYLEKLVLSNTPTLSRLRMALYRSSVEKKSNEILANGKI